MRPSFTPVFDRHFHGSFSVGDRPGNCLFYWIFWELAPVLSVLVNSASKCCLSKARLTEMRSRARRSECDFARTFDHQFSGVFDLDFGVRPFEYLPVYRCFLDLGCWLGPLFRPLLVPVLDRISRHSKTRTCCLPYKNSLDVCLPIANKSAHPLRVRSVAK